MGPNCQTLPAGAAKNALRQLVVRKNCAQQKKITALPLDGTVRMGLGHRVDYRNVGNLNVRQVRQIDLGHVAVLGNVRTHQ